MTGNFLLKKDFYKSLFDSVVVSFKAASRGKEDVNVLIWRWGLVSYLLSYFVLFDFVQYLNNNIRFLAILSAVIICAYFIWHIYAVVKSMPKAVKLTKLQKKQQKLLKKKSLAKSFFRKLLLQEPWFKTNKTSFAIILDLLCLAFFLEFII